MHATGMFTTETTCASWVLEISLIIPTHYNGINQEYVIIFIIMRYNAMQCIIQRPRPSTQHLSYGIKDANATLNNSLLGEVFLPFILVYDMLKKASLCHWKREMGIYSNQCEDLHRLNNQNTSNERKKMSRHKHRWTRER